MQIDPRNTKWKSIPSKWTAKDSRIVLKIGKQASTGAQINRFLFWGTLKKEHEETWCRIGYIFQYVSAGVLSILTAIEKGFLCTECNSFYCDRKHQCICTKCFEANPKLQALRRIRKGYVRALGVLEKHGVTNISKLEIIKKRKERTLSRHYGVKNCRFVPHYDKAARKTTKQKYGSAYYSQTNEYKYRIRQTSLERYGVEHFSQAEEIKRKGKRTYLERTGYEHNSHNPTSRRKRERTNLKRYGSVCSLANPSIRRKVKSTWKRKYGVDNPTKNPDVVAKALRNSFIKRKVTISNKNWYVQGQNEENLLRHLVKVHGPENVLTQFSENFARIRDKKGVTYQADFYLKSYDLFIECKSWWTLARTRKMWESMRRKAANNPKVRWVVHLKDRRRFIVLPKDWYVYGIRKLANLCSITPLTYVKWILTDEQINFKVDAMKLRIRFNDGSSIKYGDHLMAMPINSLKEKCHGEI